MFSLRHLCGLDPKVGAFIENDPHFKEKYAALKSSVAKAHGVVYVGCHGGKHRSVYLAEKLGKELHVPVMHRDLSNEEQGKSTRQIFKVQRSIHTTMAQRQILAYNRDHTIEVQIPVTKQLDVMFSQGQEKVFRFGHIEEAELVIDEVAPWQNW
jgi:hypothetical protein